MKVFVEAAVADRMGNLWAISRYQESRRLLCISAMGKLVSDTELPQELNPVKPADNVGFRLAMSRSGAVALLARYDHTVGRAFYFDGAKFARVHSDGRIGPVRRVAGSGPEYKAFFGVGDDDFLAMGDQSPMVVIRIRKDGDVAWRRTFPSSWVLPSGAALADGTSCIASPARRASILHLVWLDSLGAVRHNEQIAARRSHAAGSDGSCTILYDREPTWDHGEFHLTSFDRQFRRVWTTPVLNLAFAALASSLTTLPDGYVVSAGSREGLFLAKYSLSGQTVWVSRESARNPAAFVVGSGDSFYLIGAGPKNGDYSFHVIRAR